MAIHRKRPRPRGLAAVVFAAALFVPWAPASAQVPPRVDGALAQMLTAVEHASYAQFLGATDAGFRKGFTEKMFDKVSRLLGPRLKKGFSKTYFGELAQQGYQVYVWKLVFTDGGDDVLLTLFTKDGKVSGFVPR